MKIVVLAGGLSPERNVSLSTGCMVAEALRGRGHRVALVDMFFGVAEGGDLEALFDRDIPEEFKHVSREAPDLEQVRASRPGGGRSLFGPRVLELCGGADLVFLALHGACGEDGRVQAALDLLGIPYTGAGYLGSAIAMDKDLTKRLVADQVNTPGWKTVEYAAGDISGLADSARLPCVVKPVASGSSIGVSIARDRAELRAALEAGLALGGRTVLEEYIQGRELQVGILDGEALPSIEI
ncbi:MAG TPA: D-alanine--D-alanine ligase, partial [Candidatus Galloscillospira excrementavium]|nr:D-alanine--D-alanine ligase [Candidatus Galloscillospira excrementavium]